MGLRRSWRQGTLFPSIPPNSDEPADAAEVA